jgi:hypothetical protein
MALRYVAQFGTAALLVAALTGAPASAQADDAKKVLKDMSNYLGSQMNISASFDSDIEVITPQIQKIQFASSGHFEMSRPDKLRFSRTGGYSDVEIVFDGNTSSIYGKHANGYVQAEAPGSVDQLVDRLRDKLGVGLSGADLLSSNVYDVLTSDVISGAHIGRGVIDGVECEHLAFRSKDTDWQIWIQLGDHPFPRKYVVTSKTMAAAPQYTVILKDWKTDGQPSADAFVFTPPQGAQQLAVKALSSFDEIPPEAATEGQK